MLNPSNRHNPASPQHRGEASGGAHPKIMARSAKNGGRFPNESMEEMEIRYKRYRVIKVLTGKHARHIALLAEATEELENLNTHLQVLQDQYDLMRLETPDHSETTLRTTLKALGYETETVKVEDIEWTTESLFKFISLYQGMRDGKKHQIERGEKQRDKLGLAIEQAMFMFKAQYGNDCFEAMDR